MPPTFVCQSGHIDTMLRMDRQMTQKFLNGFLAGIGVIFMLFADTAIAQSQVPLQVSSGDSSVDLSLVELDAMQQVTFDTTTIWTDGIVTFSGVSLKALLKAQNVTGEMIEMVALNDYSVTIAMSEITKEAPIIATRMNGELMSVRDKGPYWVVFPYDDNPLYQSEIVYSRSIWQLNKIRMLPD